MVTYSQNKHDLFHILDCLYVRYRGRNTKYVYTHKIYKVKMGIPYPCVPGYLFRFRAIDSKRHDTYG